MRRKDIIAHEGTDIRALCNQVEARGGYADRDEVLAVIGQMRRYERLLQVAQEKRGPFIAVFVDMPDLLDEMRAGRVEKSIVVSGPGIDMDRLMAFAKVAGPSVLAAIIGLPDEGEE